MLGAGIKSLIENKTGALSDLAVLSGGDIHRVYTFDSEQGPWVAKVASEKDKRASLKAEIHGLQLLNATDTFIIPEVLGLFETEEETALVMRFIKSSPPHNHFWEDFAMHLAALHSNTKAEFGLDRDNFIGALPQYNHAAKTAVEFYINDRLEPQLKMARQNGYTFDTTNLYRNLKDIIAQQSPALIHGDLWNGNYLASADGPVLIDPAVCYGIAEMDLGMMALFGGFPKRVFDIYAEIKMLDPDWRSRIELWQLYYLLVHLNLFGSSYLGSVRNIVSKYS